MHHRGQRKRAIEDELRDPRNFLEYLLPRPLRKLVWAGSAASCTIAAVLTAVRLIQVPDLLSSGSAIPRDLVINLLGLAMFIALYDWEQRSGQARIEQRREMREAQIRTGDREVFINEQGEKMSRLKEVNDEWILRRLERWGRQDDMPFPLLAVEVGTMAGYSAITIAQSLLQPGSKLLSFERELQWVLVSKRFLWQASQGEGGHPGAVLRRERRQAAARWIFAADVVRCKSISASRLPPPNGSRCASCPAARLHSILTACDRVEVVWGDVLEKLSGAVQANAQGPSRGKIDLLFLDGVPKQYLEYLKSAEPFLAPGALIGYLQYVRSDPRYRSEFIESTLEWRDEVVDGLEVSTYLG
ncbi:MAG: hypothetical protein WDW36_005171 [Sanguina aurantia]